MSAIRGCDKCGYIFFENAEGWSSMAGTRNVRDANGVLKPKTAQLDFCPTCSEAMDGGGNTQQPPTVVENRRKAVTNGDSVFKDN